MLGQHSFFIQVIKKLASLAQTRITYKLLNNKIIRAFILEDLIEPDNIGMGKLIEKESLNR